MKKIYCETVWAGLKEIQAGLTEEQAKAQLQSLAQMFERQKFKIEWLGEIGFEIKSIQTKYFIK